MGPYWIGMKSLNVELKGDNLAQFLTDWEQTMLSINEIPTESMLESLLRKQRDKSEQLGNAMAL